MAKHSSLRHKAIDDKEEPDLTVMHIPGNCHQPLSLRDQMRQFVREELSKQAEDNKMGSFEDEDDFSEDDPEADITSPYEVTDLIPDDMPLNELDGAPNEEDLNTPPPGEMKAQPSDDPAPSPEETTDTVTST